MAEKISTLALYGLMLGMLITGTLNTISLKLQNGETYKNNGKETKYNHPFVQTFFMFVGEFFCMFVYAYNYYKDKKTYGDVMQSPHMIEARKKGLKTDINVVLLAIPACFDICASTLMFVALTMIAASVYQMMRGLIVFVAAILSIIFLNRRFYRHHWFSLTFVVIGVGLVGASPIIYPDPNEEDDDKSAGAAVIGIILVIVAQLFAGGLFITEEKLLGNYYLHPLKVVGWEGFWGCFIYIILLFIMYFIPCTNQDICPYGKVEDTPQAFYEFGQNNWIWIFAFGSSLSIAFFNGFGVAVTKYASAAQRSTIDTSRTLLIWMFFIFYQGAGHERFIWLELVGFFLLVIGTFVFNEIIVIPCMGFNLYTKDALARNAIGNEDEDKLLESNDASGYQPSSPAHYDYQKNYKHVADKMGKDATVDSDIDMKGV